MAVNIPPPPTNSPQGDRVWTDWYIKLSQILSSTAGVAWALVDKAGSQLSDLASRPHSQLQSVLGTGAYHISLAEAVVVTDVATNGHDALTNVDGTGDYHVSSAEATTLTNIQTNGHGGLTSILGTGSYHVSGAEATTLTAITNSGQASLRTGSADPTVSDVNASSWAIWKNTTSGEIRLWVNDGGTMKKSAALT